MYRRWRVRHSYPKPVVDLVVRLLPLHGAATLSRLLDIPASVIYRWRGKDRGAVALTGSPVTDAEALATLVARCADLGFRLPGYARASAARPPAPIDAAQGKTATGLFPGRGVAEEGPPLRTCGDGAGGQGGLPEVVVVPDRSGLSMRPPATGQRYVFDVSRERPERGVRSRMEAVRHAIDTRYFLDVDCRTLAEMAHMSLHHFMRVFRDMFGMSPHQYLTRARIGAAKRLLLASSEPLEVIAVGVGFRSGPCLNRAFKRLEGTSASRYCQTVKKGGIGGRQRGSMPPGAVNVHWQTAE